MLDGQRIYATAPKSLAIDTSAFNLAATYTTNAGYSITGLTNAGHLIIINNCATAIAVNVTHGSTASAPSTGTGSEIYCAPTGTVALDDLGITSTVYVRSTSGSLSSGIIYLMVW